MSGQGGIANAHVGNLCERGLKRGQKLALKLAVDIGTGIIGFHIAANVGVEQQRVDDMIAVLTEAANGDVHVKPDIVVNHAEGHWAGGTVLVSDNLFGVDIVHALVLGSFAAIGETLAYIAEHGADARPQAARENGRLRGGVVYELAGFGADLDNLALLDYEHTLTCGYGYDRACGDDVVAALVVG